MTYKHITFYGTQEEIKRVDDILPVYTANRLLKHEQIDDKLWIWKQSRLDLSARTGGLVQVMAYLQPRMLFQMTDVKGRRFHELTPGENGNFPAFYDLEGITAYAGVRRRIEWNEEQVRGNVRRAIRAMYRDQREYEFLYRALLRVLGYLDQDDLAMALSLVSEAIIETEQDSRVRAWWKLQRITVYECMQEQIESAMRERMLR